MITKIVLVVIAALVAAIAMIYSMKSELASALNELLSLRQQYLLTDHMLSRVAEALNRSFVLTLGESCNNLCRLAYSRLNVTLSRAERLLQASGVNISYSVVNCTLLATSRSFGAALRVKIRYGEKEMTREVIVVLPRAICELASLRSCIVEIVRSRISGLYAQSRPNYVVEYECLKIVDDAISRCLSSANNVRALDKTCRLSRADGNDVLNVFVVLRKDDVSYAINVTAVRPLNGSAFKTRALEVT